MKKILCVDDDDITIEFVVVPLEEAGYEVVTSNDGHDAYEKYLKEKPDLIITDIFMKHNGIELINRIREIDSQLPIITLSGGIGVDDGAQMLDVSKLSGATYALQKPYPAKELNDLVESLLK